MDQQNIGANGQGELFKRRSSEIPDADRISALQGKLYQKAKQEKNYKFYVLYDKIFLPYVLREAWKRVRQNGGASGIDKVSIVDIEKEGVEEFLKKLGEELRKRIYKPQAVKRVMIPKANGGQRPLGIPTVKDRVVQTTCKIVLEPIFEADFENSSHGFRPNRSAADAITQIKTYLQEGKTEVLDADLSQYFDTIPHDRLLIAVKERISDPRILALLKGWLKVPVYEDGQFKGGKRNGKGTPQGGVISPLLANIYLHLLDRIVNCSGSMFDKYGVRMIRYADDFVLMGRTIPKEVLEKLNTLLSRMGLVLNTEKSKLINATKESFNFLGFSIRYSRDLFVKGRYYWNIFPSKKSEARVREKIRNYLDKHGHCAGHEIAKSLNSITTGWINYFEIEKLTYPAMSKRRLRHYMLGKLYRFFNRKSQRKSRMYKQKAFDKLIQYYGMIDPSKYSPKTYRTVNTY